jgi:hypothetical protein
VSSASAFPQPFGKFVLTSLLARGGMSQVLLAKSEGVYGFRRLVVIKRMLPLLAEDPNFVQMFHREAQLGGRLQHPNIVQVFEWGQVDGQLFLAMEFVDGLDLRVAGARLRHDDLRWPLPLSLHIACEVLRGLDYAHRAKDEDGVSLDIVHRDVSPSNVLLSRDGAVKVCDFGIATGLHDAASLPHTVRGKYAYMSPEQASGEKADLRSDLFSVGILLWEMITGARLYRTESEIGTLELAQKGRVPSLADTSLPGRGGLQAILDRALARDPAARYPTAMELRRALIDWTKVAETEAGAEALAAFMEKTCPAELRRRGQRRDGLPVDPDRTPATPTNVDGVPAQEELGTGRGRAYVPELNLEAVSLPELFPEVESRPPVEHELIVSRPPESRAKAIEGDRIETPEQPALAPVTSTSFRATAQTEHTGVKVGPSTEDALLVLLRGPLGVDEAAVIRACERSHKEGTSLSRALLADKVVQESALCHALGEASGIPTVDVASWSLAAELATHVPELLARTWDLVPFRIERLRGKGTLCVAIAEPESRLVEPEIQEHGGMRVKFFLARPSAIHAAFVRLYHGVERPIPPLYPKGMAEP